MIIALCGFAGSGKNTAGEFLIEKGFIQTSFAKPLKDVVSIIFDWQRDLLEGETKESRLFRETPDDFWSKKLGYSVTPRYILQTIGTDVFRKYFSDNIWIDCFEKQLEKNLSEGENIVVTDVRFYNEFEFLKKYNTKFIQINSPYSKPTWYDILVNDFQLLKTMNIHSSEYEWFNNTNIKYFIENDSSVENLYEKINAILEETS